MYRRLVIVFLLTLLAAACMPYVKYAPEKNISDLQSGGLRAGENTLPSGRKIVINSVEKMDFQSGDPSALVLNYTTAAPIDHMPELRAEVDEVWLLWVKHVEAANLSSGVLRPVNGPKGYGFVFMKRDDGTWYCLGDEKK